MRVMVIGKATKDTEAGIAPSKEMLEEFEEMGKFNEQLVKAGVLLATEGLHPSSKGKRVRFSGGQQTVIDGPFSEAKEVIAGFQLWQVSSMEEALEWIRRAPIREGEVEIRPVFDVADFASVATPEHRERMERFRAEQSAKKER